MSIHRVVTPNKENLVVMDGNFMTITIKPPRAAFTFGAEWGFRFNTTDPMPCWFHRAMQRIFFGIRWKEIK